MSKPQHPFELYAIDSLFNEEQLAIRDVVRQFVDGLSEGPIKMKLREFDADTQRSVGGRDHVDLPPLTEVRGALRFSGDHLEARGIRGNLPSNFRYDVYASKSWSDAKYTSDLIHAHALA